MEIIDCTQNSEEWLQQRIGIPTASEYSKVLAKGRGNAPSKTRLTYLYKLAGERLTGQPCSVFAGNVHTERGHEMESDARAAYEFQTGNDTQLVGFVRNGQTGASPDGLIDADGVQEIKSKLPHLHIPLLLGDAVPPEHKPQIQGELWVCEREWCDFVSYWPHLPLFVKRVYRDEDYIKNLAGEVDRFNDELDALVERLQGIAA